MLLKEAKLVDRILINFALDKRWIEYNYSLYSSSWFYENTMERRLDKELKLYPKLLLI